MISPNADSSSTDFFSDVFLDVLLADLEADEGLETI
jgi:hypothetical protein